MILNTDVMIIGAGAAGLMCAIEAGKRGRKVIILEYANKCGKKILISGGGRCNFTNYNVSSDNYLSNNPNFCKSALSRYTPWDFIRWVEHANIDYFEKGKGQLFCKHKSRDILNMLLFACERYQVEIKTHTQVLSIEAISENHFKITTANTHYHAQSLVIATGGLSFPTMGASPFGYQIAEQFNLTVLPTRAGLVPLTLNDKIKQRFKPLSGVSLECHIYCGQQAFKEGLLFTHRGLSGPSVLQISSYWHPGDTVTIDLMPEINIKEMLIEAQQQAPNKSVKTVLYGYLPKSVVNIFLDSSLSGLLMKQLNHQAIDTIHDLFSHWQVYPTGTEGYRTAEVTLGGVDVNQLSSKTMETNTIKGLYFIGEVLDVTGWLGGYNFQWAWSSGWAAGQYV